MICKPCALLFLVLTAGIVLTTGGCSGPYDRLKAKFENETSLADERRLPSGRIVLNERSVVGTSSIGASTDASLSSGHFMLRRKFDIGGTGGGVRIPAEAVDACSMICFGGGDRYLTLIVETVGIQIEVSDSRAVREWCWHNRIPVASGAERRNWQYSNGALPVRASAPLSSEVYQRKLNLACAGY